MDRPPTQRVEVVVPARTLLVLLAVGAIVLLVILSIGTLLSAFTTIVAVPDRGLASGRRGRHPRGAVRGSDQDRAS